VQMEGYKVRVLHRKYYLSGPFLVK